MDGPLKRIHAARKLWGDGLKEDAAALIFIATAAVSRLRYPRNKGFSDRAAFTAFVREQISTITGGATHKPLRFPKTTKLPEVKVTENVPLEDILYGAWRCVMIHEARWPPEVYLTETRTDREYSTYIDLPPDGRLGLPEEWILGLAFAVECAVEILLPRTLQFPVYSVLLGPVADLGSNRYQLRPGETKIPRIDVRNQKAVPIFTNEQTLKVFRDHYKSTEFFVAEFPDKKSLCAYIEQADSADRFVFDPEPETKLPPSYSKDTLLTQLAR